MRNAIDKKDKNILRELDLGARKGTSKIGKNVGLSQERVFYRIKRLENANIISGYSTLINFGILGYEGYAVYARLQNISDSKKKTMIYDLNSNENIYWVAEFGGKYDLAFAFLARDVAEFNELFTEVTNKYGGFLRDLTPSIRVNLTQFSREYLLESKRSSSEGPHFKKLKRQYEIKEIDKKILECISAKARLPVLEISRKLNESASTISSRIKKLEGLGIIQGYSARIHCQKLGYESYQVMVKASSMNQEKKSKLYGYCKRHSNIVFFLETVGEWNFEIIYEIEDQRKLQDLIIELRTKFSDIVEDVESMVLFDHYVKYNQYPFNESKRQINKL